MVKALECQRRARHGVLPARGSAESMVLEMSRGGERRAARGGATTSAPVDGHLMIRRVGIVSSTGGRDRRRLSWANANLLCARVRGLGPLLLHGPGRGPLRIELRSKATGASHPQLGTHLLPAGARRGRTRDVPVGVDVRSHGG